MIYRNSKEIVALYHHGKNIIRVMHNGKCVYNGCNTVVGTVPMTFKSSAEFINQYQIWGNIQQNGTPVPENPVEVQGVGKLITEGEYSGKYEIPVVCRGKNLAVIKEGTISYGGITLLKSNGVCSLKGTASFNGGRLNIILSPAFLLKRGNYKFTASSYSEIYLSNVSNGRVIVQANATTFFLAEDTQVVIGFNVTKGKSYDITDICVQLELGDTATEYEPYHEPITTSIYINELLYKGDYISKDKSGGKVHRAWGVKVFDGTEEWAKKYGDNLFDLQNCLDDTPFIAGKGFCTHYIYNSVQSNININMHDSEFALQHFEGLNRFNVFFKDSRFTSPTNFKVWLAEQYAKGTPVTVYYPLATPTEEEIELPDIPTIKGWNIIDIDTDVKPEKISLTYRR